MLAHIGREHRNAARPRFGNDTREVAPAEEEQGIACPHALSYFVKLISPAISTRCRAPNSRAYARCGSGSPSPMMLTRRVSHRSNAAFTPRSKPLMFFDHREGN